MIAAGEPLHYKPATEPWELEQIHELNYRTFVEEIPQHGGNASRRLVDRFDAENAYFICHQGDRVVGMVAVRGQRPWSLDAKLADVDAYLPPGRSFCEVRLLAIEPEHRGGAVVRGLLREAMHHAISCGYSGAVISGTVRQRRLYEHLGFVPFGPEVGSERARYQPMYITIQALRELRVPFMRATSDASDAPDAPISFLPGPVDVHPEVLRTLGDTPTSHRDLDFAHEVGQLRDVLCAIVGAPRVAILLGSGTLANDVVAAQLAARTGRGLVFANGEFGERLVDHARRAGLAFDVVRLPWGDAFDGDAIDRALARHEAAWAWMVHLETSTGTLNALPHLAQRARERGTLAAADCISAVGVVPVDAASLAYATAVSGKGIGSVPGLSLVYHQGEPASGERVPRYLDLSLYEGAGSVPFTHSSNLVRALGVAARRTLLRGRFADAARLTAWLRAELRRRGWEVVGAPSAAAPGIVTVAPGARVAAAVLGRALGARGCTVSHGSDYLRQRNWLQVAVMGECSRAKLQRLLDAWDAVTAPPSNT